MNTMKQGYAEPLSRVNGFLARNGAVFDDPAEAVYESVRFSATMNCVDLDAKQIEFLIQNAPWIGPMLVRLNDLRSQEESRLDAEGVEK